MTQRRALTPAQDRFVRLLRSYGGEGEFWPLVNDWIKGDARVLASVGLRNINRTIAALEKQKIIVVTDDGYIRLLENADDTRRA